MDFVISPKKHSENYKTNQIILENLAIEFLLSFGLARFKKQFFMKTIHF